MKISNWQLFWLLLTVEISMTIWLTISPAIRTVRQDAWISLLVAAVIGLTSTFVALKVSFRHTNLTIVEFSQLLLGKWIGRFICLLYFIGWYTVAAVILRDVSDSIQSVLFHNTPWWVISLVFVVAMSYINYKGSVEAIARFSEIVGPLFLLGIIITLLLNLSNVHPKLLLPVYFDSGAINILKGSITNASFLGESILIMMLFPFLTKPDRALKPILLAILLPSLIGVITAVMIVTTFGTQLGGELHYPYFSMVRFIAFLEFIQNMDVWIIFVWIFAVFVKMSLYLFVNSYGIAQLFHITKWKRLIVPVAGSLLLLSFIPSNSVYAMEYATQVWIKYVFPINIIALPIFFYVVGRIRRINV
ncbi:GerAB/ArcD/ProY family transporter [Paenibacillus sp. Soil724D2]|uniref:GerAB/ArcD/ProY family transporter n=1 Tax=Paenibacillus sp. (strain Soil724D2) TaxID=1736392 RepID=UPI0007124E85|nr:endospore germination permease [Paenibacillus sp. Soil724D2]KRE34285.1 hypothetical protein ASG85_13035 [Paenibacillus sp. Soil724D2]